jgi:mono/diheme cytochrome c family protein
VPAIVLPSPAEGGAEPSVVEGEALYHAAACNSCHVLGGKGNPVGPALDSFGGSGRKLDWLLARFHNPDQLAPGTTMPVVQGTDRQLRSMADYLLTLKTQVTPTAELGQKIFAERNCSHCHGSDARGTKIAPALAGAPQAPRTDAWIVLHLHDPAAVTPDSVMPRVWASDWELQSLLDYLKKLRA